ncbi:MAG: FIST N-terminal domain-containing protein [Pseudomonadota bacterium]
MQAKPSPPSGRCSVLRKAELSALTPEPGAGIAAAMAGPPLAAIVLFISPRAPFESVVQETRAAFPDTDVIACTTAGEIGANGYVDDMIVAIGFPRDGFRTRSRLIAPLDGFDPQATTDETIRDRIALSEAHPDLSDGFAFLLVDGLSLREDELVATLSHGLGGLPLFGGSAGDGESFGQTRVALNDQIRDNAAVLTLVRSRHQVEVFSLNHLTPTEDRMVVTRTDPGRRIVKEINAVPAAQEYARIFGVPVSELDQMAFAAHPVVVRIGEQHHVRSIQRVNEAGELVFFSAIDEGMVLRVARSEDLAGHLEGALSRLAGRPSLGPPSDIIACDCLLRRIESTQRQTGRAVSDVLARYDVRGFSTYGEQVGPLHVNHTMTGVAIFARDTERVADDAD